MLAKAYREVRELAHGLGLRVESIDERGKHIKVHLSRGDTRRFVILSKSPSDFRTLQNLRADMRRTFMKDLTHA